MAVMLGPRAKAYIKKPTSWEDQEKLKPISNDTMGGFNKKLRLDSDGSWDAMSCGNNSRVCVDVQDGEVVIDNGILQLTLTNPQGVISGVRYNGIDNLMETRNSKDMRGYWDIVWGEPGTPGEFDVIPGTTFKVITQTETQVEVSFARTWDTSQQGKHAPLNIDKRFVVLAGSSGFYTYAIYEHKQEWPEFGLGENRIAFKLSQDKFHYMAISDTRQRIMPMPEDRTPGRGQQLAYPEAVLLVNPTNPDLKGEVDDKYQYSSNDEDIKVHGWICSDPPTGFWMINPSIEYLTGGPLKQDLTSHCGPTTLAMFGSSHYTGIDLSPEFLHGEYWKKVFGPVFIYLNSVSDRSHPEVELWQDAKKQMQKEVSSWPYDFPASLDYPKRNERGSVSGKLLVHDTFVSSQDIEASDAYVGLALPGDVGSWQRECKGYQFWTTANADGSFSIKNVQEGVYNLYAWVPGFIGDYKYNATVTITSGQEMSLNELIYAPPRDGDTLWEIGIADRSAAEFYVPDPNPHYVNRLYDNKTTERFRQYGLWERYADLYPNNDLVFTIGESDYRKDWFYAQVTRQTGPSSYVPTTWQIRFRLDSINPHGVCKLRIAIASATGAILHVNFNNPKENPPHFATHSIGKDNSIARHGIHGLYWLYNIDISTSWLVEGENTIFLTQPNSSGPFLGIMYDYIRMECSDK